MSRTSSSQAVSSPPKASRYKAESGSKVTFYQIAATRLHPPGMQFPFPIFEMSERLSVAVAMASLLSNERNEAFS